MANPVTPESLAKTGTEHGHQMAVFCWAAMQRERYPVLRWMYAIPNGGGRSAAQGGMLKAEGVKGGVADVHLPVPGRMVVTRDNGEFEYNFTGLYIEMKKPAGVASDVKPEQIEFAAFVIKHGFHWQVCYTWEQAVAVLEAYLSGTSYGTDERQRKVYDKVWKLAYG